VPPVIAAVPGTGRLREGAGVDQAGSPAPYAAAEPWAFEGWELWRDFDGRVNRLMGDYQSSHRPGHDDEYEGESWGEETDWHRYPSYETSAEAARRRAMPGCGKGCPRGDHGRQGQGAVGRRAAE